MKIQTKLHTVFILVGPSMCGKTTFSKELQLAIRREFYKKGLGATSQAVIISSDEERQNLLAVPELHRYSPLMLEASGAAFEVLMAKYKAAISFPINSEFVIIDTTGMNETFRKEIRKVAEENEYRTELITFEYPNYQYSEKSTEEEKAIVKSSAHRFKKEVLPNLGRKDHDGVIRIKERDPYMWTMMEVEIENIDLYYKTQPILGYNRRLNIIGDVHEHVEAFSELLGKLDLNALNVLVGDYIDKGNNTAAILGVVRKFVDSGGIIVHGNHESYAVKRIKGEIKNPDLEMEKKYMSSLDVLLKDEKLAAELVDLFENHSVPFLKIVGPKVRTVYVTHAPCENKYLGKMSSDALKAQRNLYGDRKDDYRKAYEYVFKQAVGNHPLHVFGHVAHGSKKLEFRNKIFLDTGAVYGGSLTAFCYQENRYWFESVKAKELVSIPKPLQDYLATPIAPAAKPFNIHDYKLHPDDLKFLKRTINNGVRYISGTMAPAQSTDTEIESLTSGLEYFKDKGVKEVILEPKYMGSRCQMYLYRGQPEKCFLVSRNGYKIRMTEDLTTMLQTELAKYESWNLELFTEELILDGELLPWTTLGLSLVEEQFKAYELLVHNELAILAQDEEFAALDFKQKINAQELLENDLKTFSETLDLYSKVDKPYFKPFAVLRQDGVAYDNKFSVSASYDIIGEDAALIVDFNNPEAFKQAKEFFDFLTVDKQMEGLVIKPLDGPADVAPYMKVRNENYLTLVYGYDYKRRYEALCRQKRVGGKLKISNKEFDLGLQMLSADNGPALTEAIVKMIAELNAEKTLDPRL
jgi:predicted kinase